MQILILGGTGQISTQITSQLLARGDEVWHFNRGKRSLGFGGVTFSGNIHSLIGDRKQYAAFEAQMQAAPKFDCVIDMIGFTPEEAESAIRAFEGRTAHYIFCSTVDVYAHPHPHGTLPYRENAPQHGRNQYAADKVASEAILVAAHTQGKINLTIIRPSATYAEGAGILDSLRGRPTYIDRLRKGKPIIVHGDGQSLWCSCHASDVSAAFVNATGNPASFGKSYHTTGNEFFTWNQYHEIVAQAIGAPKPQFVHIPTDVLAHILPSDTLNDAAHWTKTNFQFNNIFDNRAARDDLGFRQTISWHDGAKRLVKWLDANNRIANSDEDPFDDQIIAQWNVLIGSLRQNQS